MRQGDEGRGVLKREIINHVLIQWLVSIDELDKWLSYHCDNEGFSNGATLGSVQHALGTFRLDQWNNIYDDVTAWYKVNWKEVERKYNASR